MITIYTTPTCKYCKLAKSFFKKHNIKYSEVDLIENAIKREELRERLGKLLAPVIELESGELIVGFEEKELAAKVLV